jgi:fatty acid desaturase
MQTIFKHSKKDAFLIGQTILVLLTAIVMASLDLNVWWNLFIAPFHVMLILSMQNTSLHHHTHWATFDKKIFNNVYELLLAASAGLSPQVYRIVHSVHHKYVNDSPVNGNTKDGISVFAKGINGEVENAWKFCFRRAVIAWTIPWKYVLCQIWQPERVKLPMINYILWRREQFAFITFIVFLFSLNFIYGLWFLFVISFAACFLNYAWHYGEHYGSYHHRGDTTQDSVGIYNKWYNIFCFNSGLHQEHHHRPGVHWTKLSEITPVLPAGRVIANGMHIFNVPWKKDFKALLVKS